MTGTGVLEWLVLQMAELHGKKRRIYQDSKDHKEYEQVKHERTLQLLEAQSRPDGQQASWERTSWPAIRLDCVKPVRNGSIMYSKLTQNIKTRRQRMCGSTWSLFESVTVQNNFSRERWSLARRTAVMGLELSDYIETLTDYSEMKITSKC